MTTYASDMFTRADGPVGTAETGGIWTASCAAATWAVANNQLTGQSRSGYSAVLTLNDGQSDGAVQATFGAGSSVGIVFRYTSPTDYWVLTFGANNYIRLSYLSPTTGYMVKADPGAAAAAGDVFRIELTGPLIVVFRNGKQLISISDSTRATATSYGLTTSSTGLSKFDTFTHTSLSGTVTPPPPVATVHRFFNIGGNAVAVS